MNVFLISGAVAVGLLLVGVLWYLHILIQRMGRGWGYRIPGASGRFRDRDSLVGAPTIPVAVSAKEE